MLAALARPPQAQSSGFQIPSACTWGGPGPRKPLCGASTQPAVCCQAPEAERALSPRLPGRVNRRSELLEEQKV